MRAPAGFLAAALAALCAALPLTPAGADNHEDAAFVRALVDGGEYADAIETATDLITIDSTRPDFWNARGEARFASGDLVGAAADFVRAHVLDGPGSLEAMTNLGRLAGYRGEKETARLWFRRAIEVYETSRGLSSTEIAAVAAAAEGLGDTESRYYHDAVRLYGEATLADQDNVAARVALGNLLLAKYNNTEALETFQEALEIDEDYAPARLGLSRSEHFDGSGNTLTTLLTLLDGNPTYVPARTFLAQLLIESENYDLAREEAVRALEVNPRSLEALAVLAGIEHLTGRSDAYDAAVARIDAINPRYADLYNTLAELSVRNRLYFDAVDFAQRAVDMDPESWRGYGILGVNQIRIGRIAAGHANVRKAFEGNPFNVWTKNTLDFLDGLVEYEIIESENVVVVLHQDEAALLAPYVQRIAEEAFAWYADRYDWRPQERLRVELYPDHRDFSVRTVGLSGIGILGVSFGPVVALDSPAARPQGTFNWGSVLWHEIAHSFHMGLSRHRVPRWFTEGLAVFEEHQGPEGWGMDVSVDFIKAYTRGLLLPVSELNNGFVRPSYPQQIGHSYYQASLVLEFIESRWGFGAVRRMLEGYGDGLDTDALVERELGLTSVELDAAFDAWFRERWEQAIVALPARSFGNVPLEQMWRMLADRAPTDYQAQMNAAAGAWNQGDMEGAETFLKRAKQLFPEFAGDDSAYPYLAKIYEDRGDRRAAAAELRQMIAINAESYEAHIRLADLLKALGETEEAAEILSRAVYIYPYDPSLHRDIAELHEGLGQWPAAVAARASVLALDPIDRAEAHYRLANAHGNAGDGQAARHQVLRALELAPSYPEALELLLELRAAGHLTGWKPD